MWAIMRADLTSFSFLASRLFCTLSSFTRLKSRQENFCGKFKQSTRTTGSLTLNEKEKKFFFAIALLAVSLLLNILWALLDFELRGRRCGELWESSKE
jgi:hypothetical protein